MCGNHTQQILHHMTSPLVSVLLCHPYILTNFLGNLYYFLVDLYRLPRTHYVHSTHSKNSLEGWCIYLTIIRHTFLSFPFMSSSPLHWRTFKKYLNSWYHPSPTKHTLSIVSEGPHGQKVLSSLQLLFIHYPLASQLGVSFGILQYVYIYIILDMKNIH